MLTPARPTAQPRADIHYFNNQSFPTENSVNNYCSSHYEFSAHITYHGDFYQMYNLNTRMHNLNTRTDQQWSAMDSIKFHMLQSINIYNFNILIITHMTYL